MVGVEFVCVVGGGGGGEGRGYKLHDYDLHVRPKSVCLCKT